MRFHRGLPRSPGETIDSINPATTTAPHPPNRWISDRVPRFARLKSLFAPRKPNTSYPASSRAECVLATHSSRLPDSEIQQPECRAPAPAHDLPEPALSDNTGRDTSTPTMCAGDAEAREGTRGTTAPGRRNMAETKRTPGQLKARGAPGMTGTKATAARRRTPEPSQVRRMDGRMTEDGRKATVAAKRISGEARNPTNV